MSEEKTVKTIFDTIGPRPGIVLLFKHCGFKPYSALLSNWEKANAIPPAWEVPLRAVIQTYGKQWPQLNDLLSFVRPASRVKRSGETADYSHNPIYQHIKNEFGSVDRFIKALRDDHGVKLQRRDVYTWFAANAVLSKRAWTYMVTHYEFPKEVMGPKPIADDPKVKVPAGLVAAKKKNDKNEVAPAAEDLF